MAPIKISLVINTSQFPVGNVSFVFPVSVNNGFSELHKKLLRHLRLSLSHLRTITPTSLPVDSFVKEIANCFSKDFVSKYAPIGFVTSWFQSMENSSAALTIILSFSITPKDVIISLKSYNSRGLFATRSSSNAMEWSALYKLPPLITCANTVSVQ